MYNRYIPQTDGSYQRSRLPDKARPPERKASTCPPPPSAPRPPSCPPACSPSAPPPCPPPRPRREKQEPALGIGSFLKNLLPRDIDTEDLLVILLFLLMSRDEDQNSALLTLALYLFM